MATDFPRFSIVVPLVGDVDLFEQTLASLLRDRLADTEVILVHDGTYEDPHALADEITIVDAQSRRLAVMLNRAIALASGDLIAVVRPSIELTNNWQSAIASAFEDSSVASVAPVIVPQSDPTEIVAAGIKTNYGFQRILEGDGDKIADRVFGRLKPVGPTQWAAFYRRSALELVDHFDEHVEDQYIDLDIALTLKNLGYRCRLEAQCVATIVCPALITRQADQPHGRSAQRSIVRHRFGDSPVGRGLLSFAKEVCLAPIQPSLFFQALGRLSALRSQPSDQKFALRMQQISRTKSAIEKSGLAVYASDVADQLHRENHDVPMKRAA